MPSSTVRSFVDPGDYAASIRGAQTELTAVGSGTFSGKIIRIDFDRLWIQRLSENLPRIVHSANSMQRAIVSFIAQPGPSLVRAGAEWSSNSVVRLGKDHSYFQCSSGAVAWGAMSLPVEDMCSVGAAVAGCDLAPPSQDQIITPPATAMAKLQQLHASAGYLAEHHADVIANAEAARGLEQALVQAMVDCLASPDRAHDTAAQRRHERIMRRFHTAIAEHAEAAIYIPELCTRIGVPERTLRLCCYESLGMGPKRFLLLRRMNLARHALLSADAAATKVTDIAADWGFWNFGRFAVEYKALFGEMPSATLHCCGRGTQ